MMSYVGADDMFENFTAHTCQGDWPIICRQVTVSFFVDWGHDCFVSSIWTGTEHNISYAYLSHVKPMECQRSDP